MHRMSLSYRVLAVASAQLEGLINTAHQEGWAVAAVYPARFAYGLGGTYVVHEVQVVLQRSMTPAPAASHMPER